MRRRLLIPLTAAVSVAALAAPALAHVSVDQKSVPADTDQVLRFNVPVEPKDHESGRPDLAERHNDKVTVEIPAGFTATACQAKPGWECKVRPAAGKTPHHVAFTRTGEPFDAVDSFDVSVHTAPKAGDYPFEVNQTYSDGDAAHWDGPADSPSPAPVVQVV